MSRPRYANVQNTFIFFMKFTISTEPATRITEGSR